MQLQKSDSLEESNGWIVEQDPYGWFQCVAIFLKEEGLKMMKGKLKWKKAYFGSPIVDLEKKN